MVGPIGRSEIVVGPILFTTVPCPASLNFLTHFHPLNVDFLHLSFLYFLKKYEGKYFFSF